MAHTTLASTDRALEKIGDFVAAQDYLSLKAVGRTFAQKAAVLVGLRRSIPKRYAKKAKRRLPAVNSHAKALGSRGDAVAAHPRPAASICGASTTTSGTKRDSTETGYTERS